MLTKDYLREAALRLYDYCQYPAVRYKILFHLFDTTYDNQDLINLRPAFLKSDIVEELAQHQDYSGGWGLLRDKDYSAKDKFPCSMTAINRCLYIGLTIEDRDILLLAYEYLEEFLKSTSRERIYNKNERAVPWITAEICEKIEEIKPYNELCDRTYHEWLYIVTRAYADGEYSYERERSAQHEIFFTREDRLVPMQFGLPLNGAKISLPNWKTVCCATMENTLITMVIFGTVSQNYLKISYTIKLADVFILLIISTSFAVLLCIWQMR